LILLDTHVVIWLSYDHERISSNAHAAIKAARQKQRGLAISAISLIEIARLSSQGRVLLTPDLETFLSDIEQRFVVFPIHAKIAMQTYDLPSSFPKDPVDRIIGATALIEDIPLLTADREIRASRAVPTIW
jgi:PIN domain nuclease of toxin-antitoxin system